MAVIDFSVIDDRVLHILSGAFRLSDKNPETALAILVCACGLSAAINGQEEDAMRDNIASAMEAGNRALRERTDIFGTPEQNGRQFDA